MEVIDQLHILVIYPQSNHWRLSGPQNCSGCGGGVKRKIPVLLLRCEPQPFTVTDLSWFLNSSETKAFNIIKEKYNNIQTWGCHCTLQIAMFPVYISGII
jgi:hypothetical protein